MLAPATRHVPAAFLRIEQPAQVAGVGRFTPRRQYTVERDAYRVPLGSRPTEVELVSRR
jgi:hypothetical protein